MTATVIDGKQVSSQIRQELAGEVRDLKNQGLTPGLAVILVGENPASQVYVRQKEKGCSEVGISSIKHELSSSTTEDELLELIDKLNKDSSIHGILVQLPLPKQINEEKVLMAIDPAKDVDGFHPINVGALMVGSGTLLPCTPKGIIELLKRYNADLNGKNAVVVGRSNIVGKPVALLLLRENATVEICHSRTRDLKEHTKKADVLVAAVGRPKFITGDMIKAGAYVIDVGVNRLEKGLVGDVDFEAAKEVAAAITPVPGGVGPMTIAMLLKNTVIAAKNQRLRRS
jgi:methylenetetrahydrofolate dehydrogenase (NADP+)/methenyltetrahydrofolate cyclohydrolase